ncbi:MAG: ATP-binding cassette domain-containing protein [Chitinivibrionales bacterium]|nr:ATP-binding cassette domain-containing protein [Chitinivibrionales bacterium]
MATTNTVMLDVQKLNKKFGEVHAVKDLTFQVNKGEVFGFLGPNGAGKTTTMRILTCFIPATSGHVFIDGLSTTEQSLAIRKKIGYLPENAPLYNDMCVDEYLTFVGALRGLKDKKLADACDHVFQTCGLTKMTRRQIGKLSKGFRQRVGLAQAMIHNPDFLLLDEPLSGLDPNQIIEIRELIKHIGKEKTVIYCSHILSEVSATCTRILIINEGRIVATGTPQELTANATKGSHYTLMVKANPGAAEAKLKEIPSVTAVKTISSAGEWVKLTVTSEATKPIGEELFSCAVDNGWKLSELRHEETSLEEVFTKLTRG